MQLSSNKDLFLPGFVVVCFVCYLKLLGQPFRMLLHFDEEGSGKESVCNNYDNSNYTEVSYPNTLGPFG